MARSHFHTHSHSHPHPHPHPKSGGALGWTIVFNVVITGAEYIAGALTGSLALMADATHNLSDVAGLVLAYFGEKSSEVAPTKTATYGHLRMEVFTALLSAVSLVVIAAYIVYEAYTRFVTPEEITSFPLFLTVASIGLLGNIGSVWMLRKESVDSINRKAALLHMVYDGLSSVAVVLGAIVIYYTGWVYLDPALSILIAGMIVWSSLDVFKSGWRVMMEVAPSGVEYDEVMSALEAEPMIIDAHHLHIWSLSSTDIALSCHVRVRVEDLSEVNNVIGSVNAMLAERFGISHATIQVETDSSVCPVEDCGAERTC